MLTCGKFSRVHVVKILLVSFAYRVDGHDVKCAVLEAGERAVRALRRHSLVLFSVEGVRQENAIHDSI